MRKSLAFSSEVSSLALDYVSLTPTPAFINPLVLVLVGRESLHTLAGIGRHADKWLSYSWSNQYISGGRPRTD